MPAVVIPITKVEMRPVQTGEWLTACMECDWFPEKYFDQAIAEADGIYHNKVRHDGASVDFTFDVPLDQAEFRQDWLHKTIRRTQLIAFGTIASYSLLMMAISGWVVALLFAGYGLIVLSQGVGLGRWREKHKVHGVELETTRQMIERGRQLLAGNDEDPA